MKSINLYRVKVIQIATSFFCMLIICNVAMIMGHNRRPPRLTVILVVDQFAHHYLNKLAPHLKHGIKFLSDHGVCFTNAFQCNGQPGTATGHAGLNTGTYAKDHGFVSNSWYENGKKIGCDADDSVDARVISPDGTYDYGVSAKRLMVDGLTDQAVLQSIPSYSISLKSRSAIATASKLGKPLWMDMQTGQFTSSKAYFEVLPDWVADFNVENDINKMNSVVWQKMYPKSPYAYNFPNIKNYEYTRMKQTMLNVDFPVRDESNPKNMYHLFEKTPQANQLIFDCAQACIKQHVSRKHRGRLLLWVCLSPLDKVVHKYGPDSMEAIDMIYHLDRQIQRFIRGVYRTIGKNETAFVLTADHGIMPIPELLHEKGLTQAHRINRVSFIDKINKNIEEKHGFKNSVVAYKGQELVLNHAGMEELDAAKRGDILNDIKFCVLQEPGIKHVWTYDELAHTCTQPNTLQDNMKKQLFEGRSGSIIVQTDPYTIITHWPYGASHKSPYDYDTHVPLIIFHPGKFERKYVRQRVAVLQLANTLAELLNIPKPSASTAEVLPELFDPEYK